jgi:hypothetical protein
VEGIGKLFSLATLVLNVLDTKSRVEIVFHGLNPDEPESKIDAFREILSGSQSESSLEFELGHGDHVAGSSSYFRWVTISRA